MHFELSLIFGWNLHQKFCVAAKAHSYSKFVAGAWIKFDHLPLSLPTKQQNKIFGNLIIHVFLQKKLLTHELNINISEKDQEPNIFEPNRTQSFTTLASDKKSKCVHQVKQFNSRKAGMGGGFNPEPVVPKILRSFRSVQRKIRPSHCQEILGNLLQNFNKTGGGKCQRCRNYIGIYL